MSEKRGVSLCTLIARHPVDQRIDRFLAYDAQPLGFPLYYEKNSVLHNIFNFCFSSFETPFWPDRAFLGSWVLLGWREVFITYLYL